VDEPTVPHPVVIGTAGHIDHGKTALIRALTGTDTDRLPEEKRRGITVDLGFASLDAAASANEPPHHIAFIDVPGHALFVRNMLAGATGIDAVMLVISAEEGVKPQTEEHLAICTMLGIELGLTVITKMDAVSSERLADVRQSVERFLSGTFLRPDRSPLLCVSAVAGFGIDDLRRELASLAARIPDRKANALTRLPIDRAFVIKGFGPVVTGTLVAGSFNTGQAVAIEPGARTARVRGIQIHGRPELSVRAGSRAALNLAGIEVSDLNRGDTLVEPSTIFAVDTIDAEINLLPNAPPLKHRARIHFHAFTSECMASVSLYGYQPVEPGTPRLVRLRLSASIVLFPGDRFVLRHGSPVSTIGGGCVLDAHPIARTRKAATQKWLDEFCNASPERRLALRVARQGASGISVRALSTETGITIAALRSHLASLIRDNQIASLANDVLLSTEAANTASALILKQLERGVGDAGSTGLKRSELKSLLRLGDEVLDFILAQLDRDKKLVLQNELVLPVAKHAESSAERSLLAAVVTAYKEAGLAAPSTEEIAVRMSIEPAHMRRLITTLLREKSLVRLGSDSLCVHQNALSELVIRVRALRGLQIDVAQFKQMTGLSRKYAIPLLEYLDREKVTRKQNDHRVVL
jgi:selenocysteine-specific elongation factor